MAGSTANQLPREGVQWSGVGKEMAAGMGSGTQASRETEGKA